MNYYYPYYSLAPTKPSLFGGLIKGFNLNSILNGTQKALNLANQAIPLIKQASPMINNAKTMFRVLNEFRKTDNKPIIIPKVSNNNANTNEVSDNKVSNENKVIETSGPTFFNVEQNQNKF